jgi:DNA polymerase I-like protein with 3'-5' exonuclease and polymerase domains
MLAHHLLYPQLPHSLAFIVSQYTTHPYYKDEGKLWKEGGDIDVFWRYNCRDAALTYYCHQTLLKSLQSKSLDEFFFNHVMRIQPHLVQSTVHGIKCDVELKERLKDELSEDVARFRSFFDQLVTETTSDPNYHVNPNSPAQLGDLLFKRLRLRGRGFSTDATNRAKIFNDARTSPDAKEILTALDRYKKEAKFLSTYVEATIDDDGRFRCVYKQHGVTKAPGRLSSSKTIDDTGMNLQNQPKRGYEMFMADPGTMFIYLDASQAEARVVGWYYDIEQWKEDFERARFDRSFDCHRALAAQMFKIPYDKTPTEDHDANFHPTKRFIAKRCRHGLNYRMQASRLSDVTDLPYHEAKRAWHIYHSLTPELRRGWQKEEEKVKRSKELVNAYGRPWRIIQRIDEKVLESIVAFYPQSTIGDHVQRAWYMAEEDDDWPVGHARIGLNNHDALIGLAEPDYAKHALSIMKKHMEAPITITNLYNTKTEQLIIPAECAMSTPDEKGVHRWSGLKKVAL